MKKRLHWFGALVVAFVMASASPCRAEPASHQSIEWATANSDRVIVGKVIKVETVHKRDIVTVEVHRTLRGDREPRMTFIVQQYSSGYAQGWLEDGLPMLFFLVKIDGAKRSDQLPKGFQWVLHEDGNTNSAVLLGKTKRVWPGTMDVFTRKFDYLTDPAVIVKFVGDYALSIPAVRNEEGVTVEVPYGTPAYKKVFPHEYPGNAFYLRVPEVEQQLGVEQEQAKEDGAREPGWYEFMPLVLGGLGVFVCIWYLIRRSARKDTVSPNRGSGMDR